MAQIDVRREYADGDILLGSDLDAFLDDIEAFLNVTKINDDNIQNSGITASDKLVDASISTAKIANLGVTTAKINDLAVTTAKIADTNVTAAKLASDAVTTAKILDANVTTAKIADSAVTTAKLAAATSASLNPTGAVIAYVGTSAPTGWLLCNGSAVNRTTYADLFAVIGVTHGQGDGATTFNIPDYRGYFLRGRDAGAGNDPDASSRTAMATGGVTGDAVGSIQDDAFESHQHTQRGGNLSAGGDYITYGLGSQTTAQNNTTNTTTATGGNETRPKNAYVNYLIKT